MFNDLNNSNNQSRSSVDDIFAETDKTSEVGRANGSGAVNLSGISNSANSEINAQKIGLAATGEGADESASHSGGNKWFQIILIIIIVLIVILSAYLVYSKFFVNPDLTSDTITPTADTNSNVIAPAATTTVVKETGSFVKPTGSEVVATSSLGSETLIPTTAGISTSTATTSVDTNTPVVVTPPLDSDNDGLNNIEEASLGTNPNVVDTDSDGLSDYEEVNIYHTDPLKSDTDGDSYPDGVEVNGGFNPLGDGKMTNSGSASSTKVAK
ncbi:MAG: hypothetical protein WC249_00540 [Patescibacteria group bacterium]|jgi:hypothetical protein